jgi:hypothetical protein
MSTEALLIWTLFLAARSTRGQRGVHRTLKTVKREDTTMDHIRHYHQGLDEALRLAAISTTPHAVARVFLLYHRAMYSMLQSSTPCDICLQHNALLEQIKCNTRKLDEQCLYYESHLEQFGKEALKTFIRANIAQLDLSFLCNPCFEQVQHQLRDAFHAQLAKQKITYSIRRKKR